MNAFNLSKIDLDYKDGKEGYRRYTDSSQIHIEILLLMSGYILDSKMKALVQQFLDNAQAKGTTSTEDCIIIRNNNQLIN